MLLKNIEAKQKVSPGSYKKDLYEMKRWMFLSAKALRVRSKFFAKLKSCTQSGVNKSQIISLRRRCDTAALEIKGLMEDLHKENDEEGAMMEEEVDIQKKYGAAMDELTSSYIDYLKSYNQTLNEKLSNLMQ